MNTENTENTEQDALTEASMALGGKIIETVQGHDNSVLFSAMMGVLMIAIGDSNATVEERKARAMFVFARALDCADLAGLTNEEIIAAVMKRDEAKMRDMAAAVQASQILSGTTPGEAE